MDSVLDLLIDAAIRNVREDRPEAEIRIRRLSDELGRDVVFHVRALSYDEIENALSKPDRDVQTVLSGTMDPAFGDPRLGVRLGLLKEGEEYPKHGRTPADAVTALLLPGEVTELSREIQRLSGYLQVNCQKIEEPVGLGDVKKN